MSASGWQRLAWVAVAVAAAVGCGRAPTPAVDTGAKDAARAYCEALIRRDWTKAYDLLDPGARRRITPERFTHLAGAYCRRFGFEAHRVKVRACEEHGAQAIAHVLYSGDASLKRHSFRDGVVLRHEEGGWRVVLPANFGR